MNEDARVQAVKTALERMRSFFVANPGGESTFVWAYTVTPEDRQALNRLMEARIFELMPPENVVTAERARLLEIELSPDEEETLRIAQQTWQQEHQQRP